MSSHSRASEDLHKTGISRRKLMRLGLFAGSAAGLQSAFPSLGHAAAFVPVFGAARDIGVGADGSVWVIGTEPQPGGYAIYRLAGGAAWTKVPGGAVRIAVAHDGRAWVVNDMRQIYRFNGTFFQPMIGAATDIGAGSDGTVWAVGTDPQPGGFGIYRFDGAAWTKIPGGAVRVAVGPDGFATVTNNLRQIYRFNGSSFQLMPGLAVDIGIGADGSAWAVGADAEPGGYAIYRWSGRWTRVHGGATNIAVDPAGRAWVANSQHQIYRWL